MEMPSSAVEGRRGLTESERPLTAWVRQGLDHSQVGTRSLMEVNFEPHALSMQWSWVRRANLKRVKKMNN